MTNAEVGFLSGSSTGWAADGVNLWPASRPSLEYQLAFNQCAVEVHRRGGPAVLHATSPFYYRELARRLGEQIVPSFHDRPSGTVESAIWAEPETADARDALREITRSLAPGGRICVITSGWLSRFVPEWRGHEGSPAALPLGPRRTRALLRREGFVVEECHGYHGPAAIFWGYAGLLFDRLGRLDLADRCHFRMRMDYHVAGWQSNLAPVTVVIARHATVARPQRIRPVGAGGSAGPQTGPSGMAPSLHKSGSRWSWTRAAE